MKLLVAAVLPALIACSDGVCRSDRDPPDGLCAATYEEALQKFPSSCAGECGDWWVAEGSSTCAYDPANGRLTGAIECTDVNKYCGGFCITYGDAPPEHEGELACHYTRVDRGSDCP